MTNEENKQIGDSGAGQGFVLVEDESLHANELDSKAQVKKKRINFKRVPLSVKLLIGCLLLLIVVGRMFWSEVGARFPVIAAGSYLGSMHDVFSDSDVTHFYVERAPDSPHLFVAIVRAGWKPRVIDMRMLASGAESDDWLQPLTLVGLEGTLRFSGAADSTKRYRGDVHNVHDGLRGSWSLLALSADKQLAMNAQTRRQTNLWLSLKAELRSIDGQIGQAENTVELQKKEIANLALFITDGDAVRASAQKKLQAAQAEFDLIDDELRLKRTAAARLEEQFTISQRVTPQGKLVSLARKSLQREARWFESMLKTGHNYDVEELNTALQYADQVMELRHYIAIEKDKIYRLQNRSDTRLGISVRRPAQDRSFGSGWREGQ